jgi:hypothetical protein
MFLLVHYPSGILILARCSSPVRTSSSEKVAEASNGSHLNNTGGVSAVRMCAHLHYRWHARGPRGQLSGEDVYR